MRRVNMSGYDREWPPLPAQSASERRGLINEAAFLLYGWIAFEPRDRIASIAKDSLPAAFHAAEEYIASVTDRYVSRPISSVELREAAVIAGRLHSYFTPLKQLQGLTLSPKFKGNGIVSSCQGDILVGWSRLFEVKNGDRPFRSIDFRQLSIYLALSFAEKGRPLHSIGLVNARRGVVMEIEVDDFAQAVAGVSAVTFCQSMIEAMSAHLISD